MNDELILAFYDGDQTIAQAVAATLSSEARIELTREQRQIATGLLLEAVGDHKTVGELFDQLAQADPDTLRALDDNARRRVNLPTYDELEATQRFEQAQRAVADAEGPTICAAADCYACPTNEHGAPRRLEARRWWCPTHAHLAGPDDHLPPESATIDPRTMSLRPSREEQARLAAEDERRRADSERRRAARQAEADALEQAAERHAAEHPTRVMGLPVRSDS